MDQTPSQVDQQTSPPGEKSQGETPIHTIPDKYYLGKKPNKGTKGLVIALVILVVVAVALGAAYIFTRVISQDLVNQPVNDTNANVATNVPANVNDANSNSNVNTNANVNTNSNTNTDINRNFNFNINGATNALFNTNQQTNTNTPIVRIPDSADVDNDGLTDVEEVLYGTGKDTADSDNDGFSDGEEIKNGFSPRGVEQLTDTNLVKEYLHPSFGYKIIYPSSWIRNPDPQTADGIIFSTASGEFISVSVQSNPARLSARDWYLKAAPGIDIRKIKSVMNKAKNLEGVISLDEQTVYYAAGERAYVISYNTNLLGAANYRTTFEMMYRTFELSSVLLDTNSNSNTNTTNTNSANTNNTNALETNTNQL